MFMLFSYVNMNVFMFIETYNPWEKREQGEKEKKREQVKGKKRERRKGEK